MRFDRPWLPVLVVAVAAACWLATRPQGGQDPAAAGSTDLRHGLELECVEIGDELGRRAYEHCRKVVSFGPRHVASPGWRQALLYIARELKAIGLNPIHDRWADPEEQLTFENIHATIPGETEDRILIGCHHDTKCTQGHPDPENNFHFVGANDSGSGVGLLLALAGVLAERENRATIQVVFFDGEESVPFDWDMDRALFGSRRFVERYRGRVVTGRARGRIEAFVLLDMVGARDLAIDEETNSDEVLRDLVYAAARACGHEAHFYDYAGGIRDDHIPFLRAGIPSVDLIGLHHYPHWHTPEDTLDKISADSLQVVGEVVLTVLPEIEKRFVLEKSEIELR